MRSKSHKERNVDHEEANILGVIENLGLSSVGVSGFRHLGKFDPTRLKPRQLLVKFSDIYTVEKMLARSSMLKLYEPKYNGKAYRVFLSNSLNKEEQLKEQKLLIKRREILNNDNVDPKSVHIKFGASYLKNQFFDLDE